MEKLSKRKAIKLCKELWSWLSKTGNDRKSDWPGWNEYHPVKHLCFACEYNEQQDNTFEDYFTLTCTKCPLRDLWPNGDCCDNKSPYFKWDDAKTLKTRKKYASIIADFCGKELRRMKR